jgi:hypothetical protein
MTNKQFLAGMYRLKKQTKQQLKKFEEDKRFSLVALMDDQLNLVNRVIKKVKDGTHIIESSIDAEERLDKEVAFFWRAMEDDVQEASR